MSYILNLVPSLVADLSILPDLWYLAEIERTSLAVERDSSSYPILSGPTELYFPGARSVTGQLDRSTRIERAFFPSHGADCKGAADGRGTSVGLMAGRTMSLTRVVHTEEQRSLCFAGDSISFRSLLFREPSTHTHTHTFPISILQVPGSTPIKILARFIDLCQISRDA